MNHDDRIQHGKGGEGDMPESGEGIARNAVGDNHCPVQS